VASSSSTSDTASITITVDRTGLADGNYSGTLSVDSNGGTQVIDVSLTVDTTSVPLNINLFVLLLDSVTFATVAEATVNPTTGLAYSLPDLPAGDYYLVCGSDDNNDMNILGPGDTYGGIYPTANEPVVLTIGAHQTLSSIDFPVINLVALLPRKGPGYRLLHH
jgi:serine protease